MTYSGLKMLETIITEAFFLYPDLVLQTFAIDRTTWEVGGYLFNTSLETNLFGQKIYGEVILNESINDQIMSSWGRSLLQMINACLNYLDILNLPRKIKL